MSSRNIWICLVVLLALAGTLRFWGVGEDSLWNNEVLSHERASQATWSESYALLREGTHPPLYSQGVLRPAFLFGDSEFFQRAPSVLFGIATILLTFVLGRAMFSVPVGLAAAALLSITPLHLYYSREGRMYALLALITTAWLYFLTRAMKGNSWSDWLSYSVLAAASLYTHYYSGLTLVAVAVFVSLYLAIYGQRRYWSRWLSANALAGALFLPWVPTLLFQIKSDHLTPSLEVSAAQPIKLLLQFFMVFESPAQWLQVLLFVCLVVCLGAGIWTAIKLRAKPGPAVFSFGLLVAAIGGTFLLASLISLHKPMLYIRYFVGVVPAFLILLVYGPLTLRPGVLAKLALVIIAVISAWYSYFMVTTQWRPDFRTPITYVEDHQKPGELLFVVAPDGSGLRMKPFHHYYDDSLPVTYHYGRQSGESELRRALEALPRSVSGVWVFQHRRIIQLEDLSGFDVKLHRVWRTRSFERSVRTSLTYLER